MAKSSADLSTMSDEDFMDAWTAQGEEVAAGRERLREFSHEHQRRERKKQLAAAMNYSDEDLALLQEVVAEGVESQEEVNG